MSYSNLVHRFTRVSKWLAAGILLALLLLLAACGGTASPANQTSPPSSPPVEEEQPKSNADQEASVDSATRKIIDAMGEVTVPSEPARIVVLDNAALDNLLALDVKPIGAASVAAFDEPYPSYLSGTDGITNIGTIEQPNLETISRLSPDLIIGTKVEHEAVYDKLKQIAPTVFIENVGVKWKDNLRLHAEAAGKPGEAARLLEQYEQRTAEFKQHIGEQTIEVALLRPRADHVRVYLKESFSGHVADDAGLTRPAPQNISGQQHIAMTEEQIADLDADVILWFGRENEMGFFNDKIVSNPIWSTLRAVQNDQVHQVSPETWLSGHGIQSANLMLDDLERIFLKP